MSGNLYKNLNRGYSGGIGMERRKQGAERGLSLFLLYSVCGVNLFIILLFIFLDIILFWSYVSKVIGISWS